MTKRREYKHMSLAAAIESQQRNFPTTKCYDCNGEKKLVQKPHAFLGVTVWDFPQYECEQCGSTSHRSSVAIAIEILQEKFNLHGGFKLDELIKFEKQEKSHPNE